MAAGGGLIWWGVALIVLGVILGATGAFGLGGMLTWLGWLMLIVGVILAIVHLASHREPRPAR
jgi:hypothetical protein